MARLGDLVSDLDAFLGIERFKDYGPNGLQVPPIDGDDAEIRTVYSAVSADAASLDAAAEAEADLVIVHHGLFWDGDERRLDRVSAGRLRTLLRHDIALAAYHLPLDGHPEVGNNRLLADALGAESELWAASGTPPIGVVAHFRPAVPVADLTRRITDVTGGAPVTFAGGPAEISRLAIVSGAAASMLPAVAAADLDGLLTGEPREQTRGLAAEYGVHAFCAGHHATETLGVQALGARLATRFDVEHRFFDSGNPI